MRYIIAVAAIAVAAVSCDHNTYTDQELRDRYDQGYQAGLTDSAVDYDEGYSVGMNMGQSLGYEDGYRDALAEVQQRANHDQFQFMDDWFGTDRVWQGCYELFNDWCDS